MPEGDDNKTGNNQRDPNNPPGPGTRMPPRGMLSWLVFMAVALVLVVMLTKGMQPAKRLSITEFENLVANNQVEELSLKDSTTVTGKRKRTERDGPDAVVEFEVLYLPSMLDHEWLTQKRKQLPGVEIKALPPSYWLQAIVALLPWVFIILFLWFFVFRQIRAAGGGGGMLGSFGRSKHRVTSKEHVNVSFADVAGVEEAQEEVQELIEFLKNPKKFQRLGGRIPRGVLLVGQPGCGKTLLAKAIAGEADVPFFSISGSDFVEMFVGVGASRVRDLFKQAKDNSPCIIFLDEIDAVGRRRGGNFTGGGHDEREQTLNAILVEMDGFETVDQVIVIAATNRVDVLDPALIRPGRFDRQVFVPLPDVQGRYEILKVHCKNIRTGPTVDLRRLARATPMFSGAELAAVINEAAILATMSNKDAVEMEDLEEARDKVRWGRARKSRQVDEHDQKVTAYHEAGHAIVQAHNKHADPLHKVSILPRGNYGGATFSLPERDRMVYTKDYLVATIMVAFGGRIAEDLFVGEISSGAGQDIKMATYIARQMVKEYGMNEELGFVYYGDSEGPENLMGLPHRDYSDNTADLIDREIKKLIDRLYCETKELLESNRDQVVELAEALLKYETLSGEEVQSIIRGEGLDKPTISDLLDEEHTGQSKSESRADEKETDPGLDLGGGQLSVTG